MAQTAANNPFARRVMDRLAERPLPESLNSDPEHRFFDDPPELIQRALGGREWFFERGFRSVHRVGIFKGIGWELDPVVASRRGAKYTGALITMSPDRTCTIELVERETLTNPELDASTPVSTKSFTQIHNVRLLDLKHTVESVLGYAQPDRN